MIDKREDAGEYYSGATAMPSVPGGLVPQPTIKGEFKVVEYFIDEDGTKHLAYLDNDGKRTSTEIASFAELFALAKMNRVRLYYHAVGDTGRKALYHPHMVDDEASPNPVIRFDATGILGGKVYTRSIAITETSSGGISITPDGLTELAKKSDIPDVSGFAVDTFVGTVARTGKEIEIKNAAIISEMTIPISVLNGIKKLVGFRLRCANNSSGTWASSVWFSVFARSSRGATVLIGRTSVGSMRVGEYADFAISNPVTLPDGAAEIVLTASAATRIALANTVEDYLLRGSTGSTITGYKPIIDLSAEMTISDALQLLADRSLEPTGGVAANVNLTAPDGTRWALGVNNDGTLLTTIPDASAMSDEEDVEIE